jgi:hypothetical protein
MALDQVRQKGERRNYLMALGDGIRRNIAHVDSVERALLRDAILEMHKRFYPGNRGDKPLSQGEVSEPNVGGAS